MNPYAGATTVTERRDSIYEERRLLALCPWLLGTSQTPNIQSTNIATVDAHWVCYMPARGVRLRTPHGSSTYIHIGVGFCVARSGCMGNAKASKSGTATIQTPALFRIYATTSLLKTFPPQGVWRKQQENNMNIPFMHLQYPIISERAKSWSRKASRYKSPPQNIGVAMDAFIFAYIAYAAWVSLFKNDEQECGGDRQRCVYQVSSALESYENVINQLDTPARELAQAISHGGFNVRSSCGTDPELGKNWDTPNGLKALLNTLYNIRCNLFHGQKSMEKEQIAILTPANDCMKILNRALSRFFKEEYDRFINEIRQS